MASFGRASACRRCVTPNLRLFSRITIRKQHTLSMPFGRRGEWHHHFLSTIRVDDDWEFARVGPVLLPPFAMVATTTTMTKASVSTTTTRRNLLLACSNVEESIELLKTWNSALSTSKNRSLNSSLLCFSFFCTCSHGIEHRPRTSWSHEGFWNGGRTIQTRQLSGSFFDDKVPRGRVRSELDSAYLSKDSVSRDEIFANENDDNGSDHLAAPPDLTDGKGDLSKDWKRNNNDTVKTQREKLDIRAKSKLRALSDAKLRADGVRRRCEASMGMSKYYGEDDIDNTNGNNVKISDGALLDELHDAETDLSRAYSLAIKYVARTRQNDAASKAEELLHEMISRTGAPSTNYPLEEVGGIATSTKGKATLMLAMVDGSIPRPQSLPDITASSSSLSSSDTTSRNNTNAAFPIVPPTRKDFHNVLHSWASSKARRKGLHAEALMLRMSELAWWYPHVFDTVPNSKTFALVAKCLSGSTHSQSVKKITHLNEIHDAFAGRAVRGITRHDPFLLIHSLKALKNYRKAEEAQLADEWLEQLHSFVMNPANNSYLHDDGDDDDDDNNVNGSAEDSINGCTNNDVIFDRKKVDLTGTYTTVIREYARLRGQEGAAANARNVLNKMHEVLDLSFRREEGIGTEELADVATIDIKTNAYNLVLGLFRDSKDEKYAVEALSLLEKMIAAWKERKNEEVATGPRTARVCIPDPTEQSFEYCILSLANMEDVDVTIEEATRIISDLEHMRDEDVGFPVVPSIRLYNSVLEIWSKLIPKKPDLILSVEGLVKRTRDSSTGYSEVVPNVTTWSHVLKAYSATDGDIIEKKDAIAKANGIFKQLESAELTSPGDERHKMTDTCYFHMMKVIANLVDDEQEKQEAITQLFKSACEKGLVSANVLRSFKNHVPEETFVEIAGDGRLADTWIANVTSAKALYTDGTMGGAGKNARRKGKSTSNWLKKQRRKEEEVRVRKETKAVKKALKTKKIIRRV